MRISRYNTNLYLRLLKKHKDQFRLIRQEDTRKLEKEGSEYKFMTVFKNVKFNLIWTQLNKPDLYVACLEKDKWFCMVFHEWFFY